MNHNSENLYKTTETTESGADFSRVFLLQNTLENTLPPTFEIRCKAWVFENILYSFRDPSQMFSIACSVRRDYWAPSYFSNTISDSSLEQRRGFGEFNNNFCRGLIVKWISYRFLSIRYLNGNEATVYGSSSGIHISQWSSFSNLGGCCPTKSTI